MGRATTHTDLLLRAREQGIPVRTIHNASIMNAVGACGLQLYTFGQTVSIVFFTPTWKPDSFYDKILANRKLGLHTLCLLGPSQQTIHAGSFNVRRPVLNRGPSLTPPSDIKMKEQSTENLMLYA